MKNISFDSVNTVVSQFCTARRIPYSAEMLATEPEAVYDAVTSFELCKGDRLAADVSELIARYMEVC